MAIYEHLRERTLYIAERHVNTRVQCVKDLMKRESGTVVSIGWIMNEFVHPKGEFHFDGNSNKLTNNPLYAFNLCA